jgi:probable LLM family oxidoreductase
MQIGIDSFAAASPDKSSLQSINELLDRIEHADKVGLDVFGIGEHHRKDFLDSANAVILAAAASRTKKIILTSAVSVLSAIDPVRLFQQFATLDLVSNGRAEMVVGRASFIDAFPLFGLKLEDYDALFVEKLDLLLKIRDNETVTWSGQFRPRLNNQAIYPRPLKEKMPIWIGVGGTPESFVRAGSLGLPLMVAVIGGETHRFRPLIDMYRKAGEKAGFNPDQLQVGLHSLGYVAESYDKAVEEYYPGYKEMFTKIGRERGWAPIRREHFDTQTGPTGAFLIGSPEEVAEKIIRHSKALGGISRLTFQMDNAGLTHEQLLNALTLIGTKVSPLVKSGL